MPIGDRLSVTTDLVTTPGIVYLVGQDRDQVVADYERQRELRMHEIFQLAS
ncbi:hypothetical protein ABLO27_12840 [Roseibium sp. SCPC15]|uniref:hypothetical protein n=1 Tax=Roseibium sp. SCP15 TaxID=3141376 RepID=UPI00333B560A